jgi:hypothetical protein
MSHLALERGAWENVKLKGGIGRRLSMNGSKDFRFLDIFDGTAAW